MVESEDERRESESAEREDLYRALEETDRAAARVNTNPWEFWFPACVGLGLLVGGAFSLVEWLWP